MFIRGAEYDAHSHVRSTASISGLGDGVDQLPADAKITQFNVAVSIQENVGGFDV